MAKYGVAESGAKADDHKNWAVVWLCVDDVDAD